MTVIHRRPGAASVAALGVITLTVAAAHAVAPNWSQRLGLDVWNYSEYAADLRECTERRKELEAGHDRLLFQIDAGDRIAGLVIDRHLTLAEAADEAFQVNQGRSGFSDSLGFTYGNGTTARERYARYVIDRVRIRLEDCGESSRLAEVMPRLEAEYRELPTAP